MENPQAEDEEHHDSYAQAQDHPAQREGGQCVTIEGGNHGITQSLRGIGQGVEERDDLEPFDRVERTPGVVGAARKDQGREDQREHQADLFRLHRCADGQAKAGTGESGQDHDADDHTNGIGAYGESIAQDPVSERENDGPCY